MIRTFAVCFITFAMRLVKYIVQILSHLSRRIHHTAIYKLYFSLKIGISRLSVVGVRKQRFPARGVFYFLAETAL
jgi:hypothetical protein